MKAGSSKPCSIEKCRTCNTQSFLVTRMTLDRGSPGSSGWTFGLPPVVSAMLSGVVGACVAMCGVVYVTGSPVCVVLYHVFFACCVGILRHSDVSTGPPVFLLGG